MKIGSLVRQSSEAWLLFRGYGYPNVPGELKLADGRLSFTAFGCGTLGKRRLDRVEADAHQPGLADRMNAGENSVVFELPVTDVEIEFPWHYLECGLRVRVGGVQYHFCFGDPLNLVYPGSKPADLSDVLESFKGALENFQEFGKRRRLGKTWKNAISERSDK